MATRISCSHAGLGSEEAAGTYRVDEDRSGFTTMFGETGDSGTLPPSRYQFVSTRDGGSGGSKGGRYSMAGSSMDA
jgi:hypothetical protein